MVALDNSPVVRQRPPGQGLLARAGQLVAFLRRNPGMSIGLVIWLLIIVMAAFPRLFTSTNPNAQDLLGRLAKPGTRHHLLGTDNLGEDVYSQLVYGARTSVLVGFGAVLIGAAIGVFLGVIGGYFRSANLIVGVLIDIKMSFPGLLLALTVVVYVGHSSITILAFIIGLIGWTRYARIVRAEVTALRSSEFVTAAKTSGLSSWRLIAAHLFPNIAPTIGVLAVIDLSRAVLAEASLSFLGFGIQAPTVSWGLVLANGQDYIYNAWWLVAFPGAAIAIAVLAANLIGTGLQGRIDPERISEKF